MYINLVVVVVVVTVVVFPTEKEDLEWIMQKESDKRTAGQSRSVTSLRQRRLHAWELVEEEAQPQPPQHATPRRYNFCVDEGKCASSICINNEHVPKPNICIDNEYAHPARAPPHNVEGREGECIQLTSRDTGEGRGGTAANNGDGG
jgi:hypothetical protein